MKLNLLYKSTEKLIEDSAPSILTGVAVIGTVATAYLAARAGFKTKLLIDEENHSRYAASDKDSDVVVMTTKEVAQYTWAYFVPPVAAASLTIACVVSANHISAGRVAAMTAAYSLSESRLKEYKAKIEEKMGIKGAAVVQDNVDRERIKQTHGAEAIILGGEDVLCFDSHSGRYFKSSMEALRSAANDTNFEVIHSNYATLDFFWDLIGLSATAYSEEFGWSANCPMEMQFSTMMSSEDKPCLLVKYDVEPIRRWNQL